MSNQIKQFIEKWRANAKSLREGNDCSVTAGEEITSLLDELETVPEPLRQSNQADGLGSRETVLFTLSDPNLVCHLAHADCEQEMPHHIDDCGRFLPRRK